MFRRNWRKSEVYRFPVKSPFSKLTKGSSCFAQFQVLNSIEKLRNVTVNILFNSIIQENGKFANISFKNSIYNFVFLVDVIRKARNI